MALFGKKKAQDTAVPAAAGTESTSYNTADAVGAADAAVVPPAYGSGNGSYAGNGANGYATEFKHRAAKSGTVIGLDIGNDTIKAVELRARGNSLVVSGLGMVATPAESMSNGVVMSTSALARAVRDLLSQAGIKSKQTISSISGSNALVVRVIEVPKMSDTELKDNLAMDADRYIPFPAAEVVMDHQALRELPSDPDSPNMDVLLAAAQSEVVDAHVKVIEEAKLDPQAIDVEPLSAARALLPGATHGAVDYNDVSAIINIGATGTEVSILRGDILVFTRVIPIGGYSLTEALVEYLGLSWQDAERLKRQDGSALPPFNPAMDVPDYDTVDYGASPGGAIAGSTLAGATVAGTAVADAPAADTAAAPLLDDTQEWQDFGADPAAAPATAEADVMTSGDSSGDDTASGDPFDLDFFNQGPQKDEPSEQHGQKDDSTPDKAAIPSAFDFSFDEDDEDAALLPSRNRPATTADAAPIADFSVAPAGLAPGAASIPAPSTPAPVVSGGGAAGDDAAGGVAFDFDALGATSAEDRDLPATRDDADVATATEAEPASGGFSFGFDDPVVEPTPTTTATRQLPADETGATDAATADEDLDLDQLFGGDPNTGLTAAPGLSTQPDATGMDDIITSDVSDFDAAALDSGFDVSTFGAGLSESFDAAAGTDAQTLHSIMQPVLENLANEVRRSLEYHASRFPDAAVHRITLVGGGAKLNHIDQFFTQMVGIPTVVGDPLNYVDVAVPRLDPTYLRENSPVFTVALGLALRELT